MPPKVREIDDFVFNVMVIGDFIALFTIFGCIILALHFFIITTKRSWCYFNSWGEEDNISLLIKRLSSKIRKKEPENLDKKVSFDFCTDNDEAIYEEPQEVMSRVDQKKDEYFV